MCFYLLQYLLQYLQLFLLRNQNCGPNFYRQKIRRFLQGLKGLNTRLESDHMLNLLMELKGDLPKALPGLIAICDRFLEMPEAERWRFVIARRMGWMGRLSDFERPDVRAALIERLDLPEGDDLDLEELSAELRKRMV